MSERSAQVPMRYRDGVLAFARLPGRTVGDLLNRILPDLDWGCQQAWLWNETGYPCFWPAGADPIEALVDELLAVRARVDRQVAEAAKP